MNNMMSHTPVYLWGQKLRDLYPVSINQSPALVPSHPPSIPPAIPATRGRQIQQRLWLFRLHRFWPLLLPALPLPLPPPY